MEAKLAKEIADEKIPGKWQKAAISTFIALSMYSLIKLLPLNKELGIVAYILSIIIAPVLWFGLLSQWTRIRAGQDFEYLDFIKVGFLNFIKIQKIFLRIALKWIVPILLVAPLLIGLICSLFIEELPSTGMLLFGILCAVISPFVALPLFYKYRFALNELIYNPEMSSKEIVENSGKCMIGNRMKVVEIELHFLIFALVMGVNCYIFTLGGKSILTSVGGFSLYYKAMPIVSELIANIFSAFVLPYMNVALIAFYEKISGK